MDRGDHHGHGLSGGSHGEAGRNGGDRSDGGKQHVDYGNDAGTCGGSGSVVVTNTDAQSGTLSNGYTYTTSGRRGKIGFVQVNATTPQTPSGR